MQARIAALEQQTAHGAQPADADLDSALFGAAGSLPLPTLHAPSARPRQLGIPHTAAAAMASPAPGGSAGSLVTGTPTQSAYGAEGACEGWHAYPPSGMTDEAVMQRSCSCVQLLPVCRPSAMLS
jgi:hypothetical protein